MALLEFLLGLAIGLGIWFWQCTRFQKKLQQVLRRLPSEATEISLPSINLLQRAIIRQKEQNAKLQAKIDLSEYLLEVAPIGYLEVDEENQLLCCNPQAQQLLNIQKWNPQQLRLLLELVRSYELDHLIDKTRNQQQPQVKEWVFHPAFTNTMSIGEAQPRTLRAFGYSLPEGRVAVFIENRQPLVELAQSRDRMLSDLAHELKTPLTSIRLVAETLHDQLQPPLQRWAARILPEIDRLINLVQDWLELNQLEANGKLNRQNVEVRSLINRVWETLEPLAQNKQIQLSYSGPEVVWLNADESRLYRLFLNLFDNSIKYNPPTGKIDVKLSIIAAELQIDIIDSGPGFPSSDLPYVFNRLYRGDPARTRQQAPSTVPSYSISSGCGLGLAIARQIVLAHGGTIKAMNHPQTGGAWLQILLPEVLANPQN
ncbi:cell wall metabolism sensor histidine kinase WalK [Chroococcidiopsis sp. TS-821]|uniref:sensor histidine kinase n=1 Tax=Chroococcidiopsis sp. TS-821 TaxID=1378066 RepID=UPI000CED818D|nr:HAMP domain-containing sensor histidine kinase [Chroococcidiopsis sp. TS-821]PPS45155.1 histidine kinase [Chroococcidiopsis sp. TS-821]